QVAGDVGVPSAVDRDAARVVLARAAEIRRVEDGSGGGELGHEEIGAPVDIAVGAGRRRKVRRARRAGHVEVPGPVAREPDLALAVYAGVVAGAAAIRRRGVDRVDDTP